MNKENDNLGGNKEPELIGEYFSLVDRQGPGSSETTHRAMQFVPLLSPSAHVADVGCGTGTATLDIAKESGARVVGVDLIPRFLDILKEKAVRSGLSDRVSTLCADMSQLPFGDEELDVIWSEGAVYNIGFRRGLHEWRRFIKSGGYIAVTELTWLRPSCPSEIKSFWGEAYPGMGTLDSNIKTLTDEGYYPVAAFTLPENCWTDNYYIPQRKAQNEFLSRHKGDEAALQLVEGMRREAGLYEEYGGYYGYVFYIGRKI